MKKLFAVLSGLIVLIAVGCAPKLGLTVERAALREADLACMSASSARDMERFLLHVADDASMLPPNTPLVDGKHAIRALWSELYSNPGFALSCQLRVADVAHAGDLGYTIGTYALTLDDLAGNATTDHGKYLTVWKRHAGGQWKLFVDMWNSDHPAP